MNMNSASKPPLSNQKGKKSKRRDQSQNNSRVNGEENAWLNSIYGDPYNISGNIHPGVHDKKLRKGLPENGVPTHNYTDISDNDLVMFGKSNGNRAGNGMNDSNH